MNQEDHFSRHNFPAVYLADMLSPMLGDLHYSYRARSLMGHMTKISHSNSPYNRQQVLSDWMLLALGLKESETGLLPKHLHLMRVHLPDLLETGKGVTVIAPPPQFFMETLAALEIEVRETNHKHTCLRGHGGGKGYRYPPPEGLSPNPPSCRTLY